MNRGSPEQAGHAQGPLLAPLGRVTRSRCGDGRELWRLGDGEGSPARPQDEALAKRLLALGAAGVGGFIDGGVDAARGYDTTQVWLVRELSGVSLSGQIRARRGRWTFEQALSIGLAVAKALAACESMHLFPGPLSPDGILIEGRSPLTLPADTLVAALVGAPHEHGVVAESRGSAACVSSEISPLWTPPAQAEGAVWDSAANRYALGLLLYRLLAGEHPFSGAGLRHALGEAAHREAPPFIESVATSLPGGLQSHVLRMLDPDPSRRPPSAEFIAEAMSAFLDGRPMPPRPTRDKRDAGGLREPRHSARPPERQGRPAAHHSHPAARLAPLAAGAAVAFGALALTWSPSGRPAQAPAVIAPSQPLAQRQTAAADCAACHSRQAAEWRRSVMAHAAKSPLFNALESLIEEQVGRDVDCPNGAGILRKLDPTRACRDRRTGILVTGSGGEHWCVNCHSPAENLDPAMPAWDGSAGGDRRARLPVRDLLNDRGLEGISCGFCHQVHGPVGPRTTRTYQGNATWISVTTGAEFVARPEDGRGLFGIANSGYDLRPDELLLTPRQGIRQLAGLTTSQIEGDTPTVHGRPSSNATAYLRSSEFCGACHDVRLFGTDGLAAPRGEHFKRLRNAYSEWAAWAKTEERAGRRAASCQDCHMSSYPGVCVPDDARGAPRQPGGDPECPKGTHFVAKKPGERPLGRVADDSAAQREIATHYFSGVDVPLSSEFPDALIDELAVDTHGVPTGARHRRDLLLRHTFRFGLSAARRTGAAGAFPSAVSSGLEIPVEIENIGAGHRVPAGFSQERELWVHLKVKDGSGQLLYEVGRVERNDEDLRDKVFTRVTTHPDANDPFLAARGSTPASGLFGADIRDGQDVPLWSPSPLLGGTSFRGKGLINFQNGFLRCVSCLGEIAADGTCQPGPGQERHRGDRYADGNYDADTGACGSNLTGLSAFFETYFPVGALDSSRGVIKGPDAIIDTRSVPPGVPLRYTYELPLGGRRGPFHVDAQLLFRAFPPFLIRAFARYEQEQARSGLRPSGPLVTEAMLARLEIVELAHAEAYIP